MSETPDDLDPIDQAYVDSLTPDDTMYTGHITVLTYIDRSTGDPQFKVYSAMDHSLSSVLGYLEMAKLHMVARCEGAEYLGLRTIEDE